MTHKLRRVVFDVSTGNYVEHPTGWAVPFDDAQEAINQARAEAFEEVAQMFDDDDYFIAKEIAKKIRALKEKK